MPKNQVHILTLSCIPMTIYFKALEACLGVVKRPHLIKLNQLIALMDFSHKQKRVSIPHLFEILFKGTLVLSWHNYE